MLQAPVIRAQAAIKTIAIKCDDDASAETEVRQNDADDDNQANDVDDGIHEVLLSVIGRAERLSGDV